ncbi:MAG: hypothetical protein ABL857_01360 [Rickettsiales bacterium]|jgi:phosphate-selective porin OprO/OprP
MSEHAKENKVLNEVEQHTFASSSSSASKAKNYGAVLNGYLTDSVKVSLDYEHTSFEGGAAANDDREDEQVVFTRIGYKF